MTSHRICVCLGTLMALIVFGPFERPAAAAEPTPASTIECVDRPKGIEAPPNRMVPAPRAGGARPEVKREAMSGRASLGFTALCPEGQVPRNRLAPAQVPTRARKGNPLLAFDASNLAAPLDGGTRADFIRRHVRTFQEVYGRSHEKSNGAIRTLPNPSPACDGVPQDGSCYYYGSAALERDTDGGGMTESIEKPKYVGVGGSGHTLNELAVQGGDKAGNIVELGWLVSTDQYGDANPHLFVFHWKAWSPTCYDTCGWVQWSNTYRPGLDLSAAVGKKVYIGYVFYKGNWWAWFDNQWLGYFPGSEWSGQYTKASLLQWFGEVASENGIPPQTAMGDSQLPSSPTAASMSTLCDVDSTAWVCTYRDLQDLTRTVPRYYDIERLSFGATRYGGPGQ